MKFEDKTGKILRDKRRKPFFIPLLSVGDCLSYEYIHNNFEYEHQSVAPRQQWSLAFQIDNDSLNSFPITTLTRVITWRMEIACSVIGGVCRFIRGESVTRGDIFWKLESHMAWERDILTVAYCNGFNSADWKLMIQTEHLGKTATVIHCSWTAARKSKRNFTFSWFFLNIYCSCIFPTLYAFPWLWTRDTGIVSSPEFALCPSAMFVFWFKYPKLK